VIFSLLACFTNYVFFSFLAFFSIKYGGSENSSIYIIYNILNFISIFFINFYTSIKTGFYKNEIYIYLFIFILLALQFLWYLSNPDDLYFLTFISYFILLGLPGLFASLVLIKNQLLTLFIKYTDIISLLIVLAIFKSIFFSYIISGEIDTAIAGTDYQFLSYLCALSYGILIYNSYNLNQNLRFKFFKSKFYKKFTPLLIFICILGSILGAGRGAFLLIIIYTFSIFILNIKNKKLIYIYILCICTLIFILLYYLSFNEDSIFNRFGRIFSYINGDSIIDIENGSSGRDKLYQVAIDAILKSPIIGYGPFSVWSSVGMPHNIILEIFLQYGIFAIILLFLIIFVILRNRDNYNIIHYKWIKSLALFPLVMLFFSGSYMHLSIFWFVLGYLLSKNLFHE
jgi:O-antigen ligase